MNILHATTIEQDETSQKGRETKPFLAPGIHNTYIWYGLKPFVRRHGVRFTLMEIRVNISPSFGLNSRIIHNLFRPSVNSIDVPQGSMISTLA